MAASPTRRDRTPLIADVFSYGYALAVMALTLFGGLTYTTTQAVTIMVIFVALRGVAREAHRTARRTQRNARRASLINA